VKVERERTTGNKKRYKKEEERKKNAVRKKVGKQRAIKRLSYPLFLCHFTAGLLVRMLQML
jgi:hypothetical protein